MTGAASDDYSVVRTIEHGRPPWGRWEVLDAAGRLVGIVAEERPPPGEEGTSTFTVVHNPTGRPFRPPPGRNLQELGAWSSDGHPSVPEAVAALARHLAESAGGSGGGSPGR